MMTTVLASPKIFADDTTLPVLDPGRGKTKTGRLWCYAVDNRPWCGPGYPAAVYIYSDDRKGVHPAEHLKGYSGLVQVDGYAGFDRLVTDPAGDPPQLAFCWAHARRKIYDVFVATKSPIAEEAVRRIAALYAIESGIRGEPAEERQRVRHEQSRPLVEAMHVWLTEQLGRIPGASTLAKAILYALNHWNGLIMFLEDGRIELDTNTVERAIRPVATPVSLCTSSLSVWKHWKLFIGGDVTRAAFTPGRLHHRRRVQVHGTDLERRARNNLLGAKDSGVDQLANPVAGHAASFRRLAQGQPFSFLFGGPVGANATDAPDRTDPMGRPGLVLAGRQAHPVERGRDILVGPAGGHALDDRQGVVGGAARVFTSAGFSQTQFGVLPALPMNDQDDLARRLVDIDDDLVDQGAHQLLAASHGDVGVLPG